MSKENSGQPSELPSRKNSTESVRDDFTNKSVDAKTVSQSRKNSAESTFMDPKSPLPRPEPQSRRGSNESTFQLYDNTKPLPGSSQQSIAQFPQPTPTAAPPPTATTDGELPSPYGNQGQAPSPIDGEGAGKERRLSFWDDLINQDEQGLSGGAKDPVQNGSAPKMATSGDATSIGPMSAGRPMSDNSFQPSPAPPENKQDREWIKKFEQFSVKFLNKIFRRVAHERKMRAAVKKATCKNDARFNSLINPAYPYPASPAGGGGPTPVLGVSPQMPGTSGGAGAELDSQVPDEEAEEAKIISELNSMLDEIAQDIKLIPAEYLNLATPLFRTLVDLKGKDFRKMDNRDIYRRVDDYQALINCDTHVCLQSVMSRLQALADFIQSVKTDSDSLRKFPKIVTKCYSTESKICQEICEVYSDDQFQTVNIKKMCKLKPKPLERPPWRLTYKLGNECSIFGAQRSVQNNCCEKQPPQPSTSCRPPPQTTCGTKAARGGSCGSKCKCGGSGCASSVGCAGGSCGDKCGGKCCPKSIPRFYSSYKRLSRRKHPYCPCGCCTKQKIPKICGILFTRFREVDPEACPLMLEGHRTDEIFPSITNFKNIRDLKLPTDNLFLQPPKCCNPMPHAPLCFGGKKKPFPCGNRGACARDPACSPRRRRRKRTCKKSPKSAAAAARGYIGMECSTSTTNLQPQVGQSGTNPSDPMNQGGMVATQTMASRQQQGTPPPTAESQFPPNNAQAFKMMQRDQPLEQLNNVISLSSKALEDFISKTGQPQSACTSQHIDLTKSKQVFTSFIAQMYAAGNISKEDAAKMTGIVTSGPGSEKRTQTMGYSSRPATGLSSSRSMPQLGSCTQSQLMEMTPSQQLNYERLTGSQMCAGCPTGIRRGGDRGVGGGGRGGGGGADTTQNRNMVTRTQTIATPSGRNLRYVRSFQKTGGARTTSELCISASKPSVHHLPKCPSTKSRNCITKSKRSIAGMKRCPSRPTCRPGSMPSVRSIPRCVPKPKEKPACVPPGQPPIPGVPTCLPAVSSRSESDAQPGPEPEIPESPAKSPVASPVESRASTPSPVPSLKSGPPSPKALSEKSVASIPEREPTPPISDEETEEELEWPTEPPRGPLEKPPPVMQKYPKLHPGKNYKSPFKFKKIKVPEEPCETNLANLPECHPLKTPYPPQYRLDDVRMRRYMEQCHLLKQICSRPQGEQCWLPPPPPLPPELRERKPTFPPDPCNPPLFANAQLGMGCSLGLPSGNCYSPYEKGRKNKAGPPGIREDYFDCGGICPMGLLGEQRLPPPVPPRIPPYSKLKKKKKQDEVFMFDYITVMRDKNSNAMATPEAEYCDLFKQQRLLQQQMDQEQCQPRRCEPEISAPAEVARFLQRPDVQVVKEQKTEVVKKQGMVGAERMVTQMEAYYTRTPDGRITTEVGNNDGNAAVEQWIKQDADNTLRKHNNGAKFSTDECPQVPTDWEKEFMEFAKSCNRSKKKGTKSKVPPGFIPCPLPNTTPIMCRVADPNGMGGGNAIQCQAIPFPLGNANNNLEFGSAGSCVGSGAPQWVGGVPPPPPQFQNVNPFVQQQQPFGQPPQQGQGYNYAGVIPPPTAYQTGPPSQQQQFQMRPGFDPNVPPPPNGYDKYAPVQPVRSVLRQQEVQQPQSSSAKQLAQKKSAPYPYTCEIRYHEPILGSVYGKVVTRKQPCRLVNPGTVPPGHDPECPVIMETPFFNPSCRPKNPADQNSASGNK